MSNFSVWTVTCVATLTLALVGVLAWALSGASETPTGRHRAGGTPAPAPRPRPAPPPNTLPLCSAFARPLPVHVLRRTIMPVVPVVRGRAARIVVEETAQVMPLWEAFTQQAQQAQQPRDAVA